jgi:hypothetical protein
MHFFALAWPTGSLRRNGFIPCFVTPLAVPGALVPRRGHGRTPKATRADKKAPPFWGGAQKNAARRRVREASRVLGLLARVATAKGVTRPQHPVPFDHLPVAETGAAGVAWRCRSLPAEERALEEPPLGRTGAALSSPLGARRPPLLGRRGRCGGAKIAGWRLLEPIEGNDDRDAHQQKDRSGP